MILPILGGLAIGGLAAWLYKNSQSKTAKGAVESNVLASLKDASRIPILPEKDWAPFEFEGERYLVMPHYIAPVGIGEGMRIAKAQGLELPSPKMVDAIWKAADLKLEPHPRAHDGTIKTMNSPETNIAQLAFIDKQIVEQRPDRDYKLLAGTHKDIVMKDGKLGIYGWHRLNGKVIQGFFDGHAHGNTPDTDWKDYSQGVRLVKKISNLA